MDKENPIQIEHLKDQVRHSVERAHELISEAKLALRAEEALRIGAAPIIGAGDAALLPPQAQSAHS